MPSPIPLDEPCPCGSGVLHRDCCGRALVVRRRQRRNLVIGAIILVAIAIPSLSYMYQLDQQKREELTLPAGSTYSEEHKHWHDPEGQEIFIPGYIWSPVQRRWLKVTDSLVEQLEAEEARSSHNQAPPPQEQRQEPSNLPDPQKGVPRPEGPAPEGKVWSESHGHYHDEEEG